MGLKDDLLAQSGISTAPPAAAPATPVAPAATQVITPEATPPVNTTQHVAVPSQVAATPVDTPTAPAATPAPSTTQEPVFDWKGTFGDEYDSPEKVKSAIAKAKEDPLTHIKDPEIRELAKATNNNIPREAWEKAKLIGEAENKSTDAEKMALYLQMKKGFTPENAKKKVELQYRLGEHENAEDDAVQLSRLQLQEDVVEQAMPYLKEQKENLSTPPTVKQLKAWEPEIPAMVKEYGKVSVPVPGLDEPFVYSMDAKQQKTYEKYLADVVGSAEGYASPKDEGAREWAKAAMEREILHTEFPKIVETLAKHIENERLKKLVNPSNGVLKELAPAGTERQLTNQEAFEQAKLKERGMVRTN